MKKQLFLLFASVLFLFPYLHGQTNPNNTSPEVEEMIFFKPPEGWSILPHDDKYPSIKILVAGKPKASIPPTINLSTEPYSHSLKDYLKIVKNKNASKGNEWKDLGTIKTQTGMASLSQVDSMDKSGISMRHMHVILLKNGKIYILTAAAPREEFPLYYKDFLAAMQSLTISKDPYDMIGNPNDRKELKNSVAKLFVPWKEMIKQYQLEFPNLNEIEIKEKVFDSPKFQETIWKPFKEMLAKKFASLGPDWQTLILYQIEDSLFITQNK